MFSTRGLYGGNSLYGGGLSNESLLLLGCAVAVLLMAVLYACGVFSKSEGFYTGAESCIEGDLQCNMYGNVDGMGYNPDAFTETSQRWRTGNKKRLTPHDIVVYTDQDIADAQKIMGRDIIPANTLSNPRAYAGFLGAGGMAKELAAEAAAAIAAADAAVPLAAATENPNPTLAEIALEDQALIDSAPAQDAPTAAGAEGFPGSRFPSKGFSSFDSLRNASNISKAQARWLAADARAF